MFAKLQNGQIAQYPYTVQQLCEDNPNISFPANLDDATLARFDTVRVVITGQPEHDKISESVVEIPPVFNVARSRWEQDWDIIPASAEEAAQRKAALQASIVAATQARLDDFARTRGYDGILSACTYATSTVTKFQAEAQYCVQARDATWAKLYEMLAEVQAGTRPMPSGFEDIEAELPPLNWPT